jgi:hypothetical protein
MKFVTGGGFRRSLATSGALAGFALEFALAAIQPFPQKQKQLTFKTGVYFSDEALFLFHARLCAGALDGGDLCAADRNGGSV